jgi:hypothetical protein
VTFVDGVVTIGRLGVEGARLGAARWFDRGPARAGEIGRAWLTEALQPAFPGCRVGSVEVLGTHAGTTERGRLLVTYDDVGRGGSPPDSVFVKVAPVDLRTRLFVNLLRLGATEVGFYRDVASGVAVEVPRAYHAAVSGLARGFALVLEDLVPRGARFVDASQSLTVGDARLVMRALARLHAAFWESPRLRADLAWLKSRDDNALYRVERLLCAIGVPAGLRKLADLVPKELHAAAPRVLAGRDALEDAWASGPLTLVHGDAHAGNLYFLPGDVGLLDWQVVQCGQGMRDVSYFLANSLPTELRREHERSLIELYLGALAERGATPPDFAVAWRQHRSHALYAWIGAAVTAAAATLQQEPIVRAAMSRTSAAVLDLESLRVGNLP